MSSLYTTAAISSSQKQSTPIKNPELYGKAGLITTTKKEIVPIETTKTDFVQKSEYHSTPIKKYTYVSGVGVLPYTEHQVLETKSYVPTETKTTEYYEIENEHLKCPITEIESPSHRTNVKKLGSSSPSKISV